jgi:hypothetical protein
LSETKSIISLHHLLPPFFSFLSSAFLRLWTSRMEWKYVEERENGGGDGGLGCRDQDEYSSCADGGVALMDMVG